MVINIDDRSAVRKIDRLITQNTQDEITSVLIRAALTDSPNQRPREDAEGSELLLTEVYTAIIVLNHLKNIYIKILVKQ